MTLAYQLTLSIPEIRERVIRTLENDPLRFSRSLKAQLKSLITQPLNEGALDKELGSILKSRPRFILLDSLDECGSPHVQVLEVLSAAVRHLAVPLFLLIASGPEKHIYDAFMDDLLNSLTTLLALDDIYYPDDDIKIFLADKFAEIRRKHPSRSHLRTPRPSKGDIGSLVNKSSGQFIYASTAIKYVNPRHWPPDRLNIVFGLSDPDQESPFAELDALYHHVFLSVPEIDKVADILRSSCFSPLGTDRRMD